MPSPYKRRWLSILAVPLALAAGAGLWSLWQHGTDHLPGPLRKLLQEQRLPPHLFVGNGRIEATEVDVATRLPGRLLGVLAREGDMVEAYTPLARLDTASLEAQQRQAVAEMERAQRDREYAQAMVEQRQTELQYALRELRRLQELDERSYVAVEQVDQARTKATTAEVALRASRVKVAEAGAAIAAAQAQIDRVEADLDDSILKAPRRGRVLYRLAEPGEVLAAGGKVLTLLDLKEVYMVLFLPEQVAGRVAIGSEARIVLDAGPEYVIPASVSFVAAKAQFTPKQVETRSEREKLVFRVKASIDPALLDRYEPLVKTGLPGVAYITLDPEQPWPDWLQPRLPSWPTPLASPD
jgi:HlyD family secretion protein